jgi:SPP1 gp7 family putative phage head morphogenesis protein
MGRGLRELLNSPGVGAAVSQAIEINTAFIQSIPWEAADKLADIIKDGLISGERADAIAARLQKISDVSASKARTIARTEVSKASTALTEARAGAIGSPGYIWRTARDGDVRDSHRRMEGQYVPWNKRPVLDGMIGHAGEFPNDRCYPEPVIPNDERGGVHKTALPTAGQERNAGYKKLLSTWERQEGSPVIAPAPDGRLLNADQAIIDVPGKLAGYSLNPEHERGGHKAKVIKAALGLGPEHADMVAAQIRARLPLLDEIRQKGADERGVRFNVYIPIKGVNGRSIDVLSAWIYDIEEDSPGVIKTRPRLTTFYIDDKKQAYDDPDAV